MTTPEKKPPARRRTVAKVEPKSTGDAAVEALATEVLELKTVFIADTEWTPADDEFHHIGYRLALTLAGASAAS